VTSLITGVARNSQDAFMEQLYRLRFEYFVRQRQWTLPTINELDVDQYDCPEAVYFYDQESNGLISAHVRLTPTRTHSLLADMFPHLCEASDPRGDTIWEATRYIVRPSKRSRSRNRQAKSQLVASMLEWCLEKGITHIQAVVDTSAFATFVEMTPETQPLGLSHPYGGGPGVPGGGDCLAWRWPVTQKVIDDIKAYGSADLADSVNVFAA
jgi:acyl-homoserine lactone synthase